MKNEIHSNPYVAQLIEKGYTAAECRKPAPKKQFPCVIYGRRFDTEEQYNEALYDFLNGN